jgi:hypothetical protein
MEAAKPAPDLAVPPFAPELQRSAAAADSLPRLNTADGRPHAAHFYHPRLDAADYAPRAGGSPGGLAGHSRRSSLPAAAVEWSALPTQADLGRSEVAPAGWHVMAMRERLRQPPVDFDAASADLPLPDAQQPVPDTFKRASLNLLLMAGAAVLAGTTYILSRTVAAPVSGTAPAVGEPGAGGQELADPTGRGLRGESAS